MIYQRVTNGPHQLFFHRGKYFPCLYQMMTFQVTEVDEEENEGSDSPLVMNVIFK